MFSGMIVTIFIMHHHTDQTVNFDEYSHQQTHFNQTMERKWPKIDKKEGVMLRVMLKQAIAQPHGILVTRIILYEHRWDFRYHTP